LQSVKSSDAVPKLTPVSLNREQNILIGAVSRTRRMQQKEAKPAEHNVSLLLALFCGIWISGQGVEKHFAPAPDERWRNLTLVRICGVMPQCCSSNFASPLRFGS
jgi:hypothetical protein